MNEEQMKRNADRIYDAFQEEEELRCFEGNPKGFKGPRESHREAYFRIMGD